MRIHLVTYATPRFRLRQWILGASARLNGVVDTVTSWSPKMLLEAGFEERCRNISLSERGSGFWAWKPFIIQRKLAEIPAGDLVLYCDVGRSYPFKMLEKPLTPYLRWMEEKGQDLMPGYERNWAKRHDVTRVPTSIHESSPDGIWKFIERCSQEHLRPS
jgi:hypothetical protein